MDMEPTRKGETTALLPNGNIGNSLSSDDPLSLSQMDIISPQSPANNHKSKTSTAQPTNRQTQLTNRKTPSHRQNQRQLPTGRSDHISPQCIREEETEDAGREGEEGERQGLIKEKETRDSHTNGRRESNKGKSGDRHGNRCEHTTGPKRRGEERLEEQFSIKRPKTYLDSQKSYYVTKSTEEGISESEPQKKDCHRKQKRKNKTNHIQNAKMKSKHQQPKDVLHSPIKQHKYWHKRPKSPSKSIHKPFKKQPTKYQVKEKHRRLKTKLRNQIIKELVETGEHDNGQDNVNQLDPDGEPAKDDEINTRTDMDDMLQYPHEIYDENLPAEHADDTRILIHNTNKSGKTNDMDPYYSLIAYGRHEAVIQTEYMPRPKTNDANVLKNLQPNAIPDSLKDHLDCHIICSPHNTTAPTQVTCIKCPGINIIKTDFKYSNAAHLKHTDTIGRTTHVIGNLVKCQLGKNREQEKEESLNAITELTGYILTLPQTEGIILAQDGNAHFNYTGNESNRFETEDGSPTPFRKYEAENGNYNARLQYQHLHAIGLFIISDLKEMTYRQKRNKEGTNITETCIDIVWANDIAKKYTTTRVRKEYFWTISDHAAMEILLPPIQLSNPKSEHNKREKEQPTNRHPPYNKPIFTNSANETTNNTTLKDIHNATTHATSAAQHISTLIVNITKNYEATIKQQPQTRKHTIQTKPTIIYTPELRNARGTIQTTKKNVRDDPTDEHLQAFWEARHNYNTQRWAARQLAEEIFNEQLKTITTRNPKDIFSFLFPKNKRKQTTSKEQTTPTLSEFEKYFTKEFAKPQTQNPKVRDFNDLPLPAHHKRALETLNKAFSWTEFSKALSKLKPNRASDPFGIRTEMLQDLNEETQHCILEVLNALYLSDQYPEDWGNCDFTLLFKKGDPKLCGNYRAIGISPALAKLLSTLVHERLLEYATTTKILPNTQFGFISERRREDSIFMLQHDIQQTLKGGELLYTIFIDLTKAFDRVPHNLLLQKLGYLGIKGHMLEMIRNMYQNTKIHLKLNGERSKNAIAQEQGVRQGDPLSPLLYNLYVADLANTLGTILGDANYTGSYADDTFFRHKDPKKLQEALDKLEEYCQKWNLTVNTDKTKAVVFRKPNTKIPPNTKFRYAGEEIEFVEEFTYLGMLLNEHNNFTKYITKRINATKNAAAQFRGWYATSQRYMPISTAILFVNSLVISQATELSSIWGPKATLNQLERLQHEITICNRQILGTSQQAPSILIEAIMDIPNIQSRIESHVLSLYTHLTTHYKKPHPIPTIIEEQMENRSNAPNYTKKINKTTPLWEKQPGPNNTWLDYSLNLLHKLDETHPDPNNKQHIQKRFAMFHKQRWISLTLEKGNYSNNKYPIQHALATLLKQKTPQNLTRPLAYTKLVNSRNHRNSLNRLILACHNYGIEMGRWMKIEHQNRHCRLCNIPGKLEDEIHLLLHCTNKKLQDARKRLLERNTQLSSTKRHLSSTPTTAADIAKILLTNDEQLQKHLAYTAHTIERLCDKAKDYNLQ